MQVTNRIHLKNIVQHFLQTGINCKYTFNTIRVGHIYDGSPSDPLTSKRGFLLPGRIETNCSTTEFVTRSQSLTTRFQGEWQSLVWPICNLLSWSNTLPLFLPTHSYLLQHFDSLSWVNFWPTWPYFVPIRMPAVSCLRSNSQS